MVIQNILTFLDVKIQDVNFQYKISLYLVRMLFIRIH